MKTRKRNKVLTLILLVFLFFLSVNNLASANSALSRAVDIQDSMLGTPLDVPIDFLRTNMIDSFKVRFTGADEQQIIDLRKTGGAPCLHVTVNNNGKQLLILLNFQTSNLSAVNLKPYQVTNDGGIETHRFKLNALPEKFYVPGTITLFVFVPQAATRTGKFTLTTTAQDLAAISSTSSSTGGTNTGGASSCQLFQTSGGTPCVPGGGGNGGEFVAYVLVEGPYIGTLIQAQGTSVSPAFNILTQAEGYIAEAAPVTPAMGCAGKHFHGMIFGKDDPRDGMCGQGIVEKISQESAKYFNQLASAISFETFTLDQMKKPDYAEAVKDIDDAVKKLDGFNTEFQKQLLAFETMISRAEFMILQEQFPCAKEKDLKAKELLGKLKAGTSELFDETKASKFIIDALKCKRKMVETLVKLEKKKAGP